MRRWLVLLLCLLPTLLLAQNQAPVDITSEPHHRLLLENDQVRVFAVTLGPRDSTPLTRHEHNFLVVTLQDSEIAAWAEGESDVMTFRYRQNAIHFFFGGAARALRNATSNEYRNLTVEFLSPKVTTYGYQYNSGKWQYGSNTLQPPVDPRATFANAMPLGEAIAKDVQLLPGDALPVPAGEASELILPLSDLDLKTDADKDERIRKSQGEAEWIPAGHKTKLTNNGTDPARFVVVELR